MFAFALNRITLINKLYRFMIKILIVDDEPDILELLAYNLKKEDFIVEKAGDGEEAVEKFNSFQPDLILMDVMMPVMDGIGACKLIRASEEGKNPYIVFLTARSEEFTEVAAWEAGGNDYLIKPIKPRALISRLKAAMGSRSSNEKNADRFSISGLTIDKSSYTITKDDQTLSLPKKEFEILFLLAKNPNKIYSREDVLSHVWEEDTYVLARTVDVHIRKLREKIGDELIKTIKGVGYKFMP